MKTNKISKSVVVSFLIAILFVGSAWTIENKGQAFEGRKGFNNGTVQMLKLTPEQREQGKTIKLKFIKELTPIKNELKVKMATLEALSTGDNVDVKAVNKLLEEIGKLKVEIAKKQFAQKQAFRNILTEDQKILFDANPHKEHFKGRKHDGKMQGKARQGMRNPEMMKKMHQKRMNMNKNNKAELE